MSPVTIRLKSPLRSLHTALAFAALALACACGPSGALFVQRDAGPRAPVEGNLALLEL